MCAIIWFFAGFLAAFVVLCLSAVLCAPDLEGMDVEHL